MGYNITQNNSHGTGTLTYFKVILLPVCIFWAIVNVDCVTNLVGGVNPKTRVTTRPNNVTPNLNSVAEVL